jgi:hypothetical protein
MKFASFLIPNKTVNGKNVTKKIRFTQDKLPTEPKAKLEYSFNLLQEQGGIDADKAIYDVNPKAFRNLTFKLEVQADDIAPKNDRLDRALAIEGVDTISKNQLVSPYFNPEELAKELSDVLFKGKGDKLLSKQPVVQPSQPGQPTTQPPQGSAPLLASQVTGGNATKSMAQLVGQ